MRIIESIGYGFASAAFTASVVVICTKIKFTLKKKYMETKTADDD